MLDHDELQRAPESAPDFGSELESLRGQLAAARARNVAWRSVIEKHLEKGCPSRSLRTLLDAEPNPDEV
jgi:hypothetical protein